MISPAPVHWWHPTGRVAIPVRPSSQRWDWLPHTNLREAFPHSAGDAAQGRGSRWGQRNHARGEGKEDDCNICIFFNIIQQLWKPEHYTPRWSNSKSTSLNLYVQKHLLFWEGFTPHLNLAAGIWSLFQCSISSQRRQGSVQSSQVLPHQTGEQVLNGPGSVHVSIFTLKHKRLRFPSPANGLYHYLKGKMIVFELSL